MTLEAAIVVPIAMGFLTIFLFFFRVIQVQAKVEEALIYVGQVLAVEGHILESEDQNYLLAKALLVSTLSKSEVVEDYVVGGSAGILLLGSEFDGNEIFLHANYEMRLPVSFFDVKSLHMYSQNSFVKWNGDIEINGEDEWVYITPTGTVYHATPSCRTLDLTIREGLLADMEEIRGANGQKYYLCEKCMEDEEILIVYYTDYGSLYHGKLSCSALKRTIIKVALSSVQERRGCSYCYP